MSFDGVFSAVCLGRSYSVFSQRMLNQCLESLVQKIQSGVVINFEKTGPDPPPTEGKGSGFCSYIFKCLCYLSILVVTNIGGWIDGYL